MPADSLHFQLVFDVAREGYRYGWFVGAGLPLVVIGTSLFLIGPRFGRQAKILLRTVGAASAVVGAIWSASVFTSTYGDYKRLRDALQRGNYRTIEGAVVGFSPGDSGDHRAETFIVAGHRFSYSPSVISAGYNRSKPRGGIIRDGLRVRIAEVDGQIARLEAALSIE